MGVLISRWILVVCISWIIVTACSAYTHSHSEDESDNEQEHMSGSGSFVLDNPSDHVITHGKCVPVTIPLCQDMDYNETIMPNLLRHNTQEDAGLEAHQFFPLVKVNCSANFQFFLCILYAPVCTMMDFPIPPCRELCESAQLGCESLITKFGFSWPEQLRCSQFPYYSERKEDPMCVLGNKRLKKADLYSGRTTLTPVLDDDYSFVCPEQLKVPEKKKYEVYINSKLEPSCALPCNILSEFFAENDITSLRYFIGVVAILNVIVSLVFILTVLTDWKRFQYPLRPVFWLALCWFTVALVYIAGFFMGDAASCIRFGESAVTADVAVPVITQSYTVTGCTIMAMILYFCFLASSIWWVILTVTWYLLTHKQWCYEAIQEKDGLFHAVTWSVSSIMAIVLLVLGHIDGDVMSGVCFLGLWDTSVLRGFVLAPLLLCIAVGLIFLLHGFVSLHRIRTDYVGRNNPQAGKLPLDIERTKILSFSILFLFPMAVLVGCLLYESQFMDSWLVTWHNKVCRKYGLKCPENSPEFQDNTSWPEPQMWVFFVKYIAILIMPIAVAWWMVSPKTYYSWTKVARKIYSPAYQEAPQHQRNYNVYHS
ncbi:frizzled-7-A-like [Paramacrobiotus metropolitanus]|uniref:frizzled-7-A-like n=1 Tax=Paramacrobiotus metropolitanus TaxID=2943436 RepID=UPI002445ABA0|nr:frizzled-7-A-like [Paramacrobiotus metropolitanus]XP_055338192.1 frizzled-7-A-like [Paramacrobiotus metropolitanus]